MLVGVPREIKNNEYRVAMTPAGVQQLIEQGHQVLVETMAGDGSRFTDEQYARVGAKIVPTAADAWGAEMVVKVKEPIAVEYPFLRSDLVLFTYLHLAASRECTDALLAAGTTGISYETVQLADGSLPLLYPMSEVAGCLAPQVGAHALLKASGGRGVLMGCIGGVEAAKVVVLGGGVSGQNAANVAMGMGADVTILDTNIEKLRSIFWRFGGRIQGIASSILAVRDLVAQADLVIGAVLVPGAKAPTLVTNDMVAGMKPGSVLVDIAVDQGGCFEDTRPTTHAEPTYEVHDSLFYCVANMPGAVPVTSTYALTNVTVPYALRLADSGWADACRADPALALGLNTHAGQLTYPAVGAAHALPSLTAADVLT